MKLSENFTLEEMLQSQTAVRLVVKEQFEPSHAVIENLKKLCVNVLEPLRILLKMPINITSGYRCKRLNKLIGGANTSQHIQGKAVDFKVHGYDIEMLFDLISSSGIKFDQVIQEFDSWIHISFSDGENRNEKLMAIKKGGKTQYIKI